MSDPEKGEDPHVITPVEVIDNLVGAAAIAQGLVMPFLRDGRLLWGVSEDEANRAYPGDARIPEPRWGYTHAITVERPQRDVWPWVAQIGSDKAGFYSYTMLENLAGCEITEADRAHPEWAPRVGDGLRMHPEMPALPIVEVEPGRYFVAFGQGEGALPSASWLLSVEPVDERSCRVISRYRTTYGEEASWVNGPSFLEPIATTMDRRMLQGIRDRAEGRDANAEIHGTNQARF